MRSLSKQLFFVVIIVVLLSIGILTLSLRRNQPLVQQESPIPTQAPIFVSLTPTLSPTSFPTQTVNENQVEEKQVIPNMPVVTKEFTIEYLYTSNSYIVTIRQNPFEENKSKAQQWFRNQGIDDISKLDISYIPDRFIQ